MLFNSWTFLLFFLAVFSLYRATPGWTGKKTVLLVASYLFYAAWNPPYVAILMLSTIVDWWLARRIALETGAGRRRAFLLVSLACNLGLLCFFKYGNFLLDNLRMAGEAIGMTYVPPVFDIVLPIGISFYTFASLSYTIDVYRNEVRADSSLLDYALFVSFFPHLVAGPIVRARQLLPQIKQPHSASPDQIRWGIVLVILGLFSKVVMADNVFAQAVDSVYKNPSDAGILDIWTAVLGFSGQIYYDFSGYSLCAIGLALCFGFAFPDNFRHPYGARGFSDFWRRWHITLSSWLRDYLYIPLGGNRLGAGRTYVNLMLTMLIGGLWHGASWMFVAWGALHGMFLAIERLVRRKKLQAVQPPLELEFGLTMLTFLAVTLTWIPFRAPSIQGAWEMVSGLFRFGHQSRLEPIAVGICLVGMAATLIWHIALRDRSLEESFGKLSGKFQAALLGACLIAMFLVSGRGERAFIYFQF